MKIAVDARELAGRPTGVGRYLGELLEQWATSPDARRHRWRFFAHEPIVVPAPFQDAVTVVPGSGGTRWEQWTLPRALAQDRPDLLFAPAYSAPLTAPCPTAVTIHDVSFSAHPEWFSFREGARRRTLTAWSARRARVVVTVSAFSRDEIVKHLRIPASRIRVVASGTSPTWRVTPDQRRHEPRENMVLYVGSIFGRRHVDALIEAFVTSVAARVPASRLEIVGENRTYPRSDPAAALQRCPRDMAARVTLRSYVDDATLRDLYRRASVFAFPSEYEGFGLTPLEALAAGVPPVVLDTPIAREVYGNAARFVAADLTSPAALADALVELLTDERARAAVLAHAGDVLQRYDWTRTAQQTLAALEEAANA
jgi:glycosyltransferase involved in cell wall biosynthesis